MSTDDTQVCKGRGFNHPRQGMARPYSNPGYTRNISALEQTDQLRSPTNNLYERRRAKGSHQAHGDSEVLGGRAPTQQSCLPDSLLATMTRHPPLSQGAWSSGEAAVKRCAFREKRLINIPRSGRSASDWPWRPQPLASPSLSFALSPP